MKDNFDKCIKDSLNEKLSGINCSEDIFNKAWNKNINLNEKEKYIMKKDIKKYVAAAALSIVVLGSCLSLSPSARAAVKTFFGLDDSGQIVEKSDEDITYVNSSINLTDENKKTIEELLGFEIKQPDNIGIYTKASEHPVPGLSVKNVKYKDEKKVLDEIQNSTDYKSTVDRLKKNYKVNATLLEMYMLSNDDNNFQVFSVGKSRVPYGGTIDKSLKIDDIDCNILSLQVPDYKRNEIKDDSGKITGSVDDDTIKPDKVIVHKSISFSYNGINYIICSDDASQVNDDTIKFATEYIKYLKSNN